MATHTKTYISILITIFLIACNQQKTDTDETPRLYPEPITVKLNTEEGYSINQLTGDSIEPIINSFGDTVITGKPIPVKGKHIHPDSISKPKVVKAGNPKVVPAHTNVHKIPDNLTVIPVNEDSLKVCYVDSINSDFVLVNSYGDTIPTGIPIPVKGKVMPARQPKPVKALPPRMKHNAINNMQYLDIEQGMASSYVWSILEDRKGNIWFGTWEGGVSKYDGESFTNFTEKEGLSHNIVLSIIEDKNENLWFGTYGGGVSKYDGEKFIHYTEKEGLSKNFVYSIQEDKDGNLWFGTGGGGVSKYDGKSFIHYTKKEGLSSNYIYSIQEDKNGNLWFCTFGGGVCKYDGDSFTHYTKNEGISNNNVVSILEDMDGNLWFGTWEGGVSKYDGDSFTRFTEKEGLSGNGVLSILEDKGGNIWFGTNENGVSKYNGESFTHYTKKEGLSNNLVWSILEDRDGNIWFCTEGGGVSNYVSKSFTYYTEEDGLSGNFVLSILEDKDGNLWFGTSDGVNKYDGKSFMHFSKKEGLSHNYVRSILEDKEGNLWFGTGAGGVNKYDGKGFSHYSKEVGLLSNNVRSILEDKSGNIWFGTSGGVCKFNGERFTNYTKKEGLLSNNIRSILEDKMGNIWFSTGDYGVSKYDGKSFTHYTEKEGLSNNNVRSMLEDKNGNIWFGTLGGGVSKYDGKNFTNYTEKEGLSNNIVWSIFEDKSSNIWVTTENGLSLFTYGAGFFSNTKNKEKIENRTYEIIRFEKQDGLKGMSFLENSSFLDSKNRIWWSSEKGLTMLDLNKFKLPESTPHIQLNLIEIQQNFIDYRLLKESILSTDSSDKTLPKEYYQELVLDSVARFYNYPLNFELPYKLNHLTFHFSAIDWAAPHKLKYQYKLEGLDEKWSKLSDKNEADYRNIPYGEYVFKVRAIGAARKWSETFEYTFTIQPPWWHTWWARIFYIIGGLLLVWAIIRWRTAKLKQNQKKLEQKVKERTKEVEDKNEELLEQNEEIRTQRDRIDSQHKSILDSILYAKRIQTAVLPRQAYIDEILPENFILFKPRNVVSGDFYWIRRINQYVVIAVADCTGHGVPGAIMSMLGISFMNE
ncbi:MAG: two-component regulator propeller domain-containing protein, partial [Bacteroidota bacterium]